MKQPASDRGAVAEAGASVLDFGIIADDAGVQGLEAALDNAVLNAADVLITSGVLRWSSPTTVASLRDDGLITVCPSSDVWNPMRRCLSRLLLHAFECSRWCGKSAIRVLSPSGGVSMGDKDFVKPLLESRGKVHFGKVRTAT